MKISSDLIIGIVLTVLSLYYWFAISSSTLSNTPVFFALTYKLFPYFDLLITGAGLWKLYLGINKLREYDKKG